MAETV